MNFPNISYFFFKLLIFKFLRHFYFVIFCCGTFEVSWLSCNSYIVKKLVKLHSGWIFINIILFRLISVFSCKKTHLVFFKQILKNFLPYDLLIFILQIFNYSLFFFLIFNVLIISKIILLLRNKFNTHFINFILYWQKNFRNFTRYV